jgi:hypothetical protein
MDERSQETKDRIMAELADARRKTLDLAHSLPPEKRNQVFLGFWSIKDLLAHLIGWDYTNIQATRELLEGERPEFYSYHDRDWRSYNARLVERYKKDSYAELLSSTESSHRELMEFLGTVPADEFDRDRGIRFKRYKITIADVLQGEADDEKEHYSQLKEFAEGGVKT